MSDNQGNKADLKSIRKSFGMSQGDFARMLKIHKETWGKWERGQQEPPAIALTALEMLEMMRNKGVLIDWINQC